MPLAGSALAIRIVLWDWFGVLFGATLGWQSVRKDGETYSHFGRLFYRDTQLTTSTRRRGNEWAGKIFWMSVTGVSINKLLER
jgi:hypothetical protein